MSEFWMKISTDNAAFVDAPEGAELARLLRETAERLEQGVPYGSLRDVNGNMVGRWGHQEGDSE